MKYCTLLLLLTFAFSTTAQQPFIFLTISPGNCLACTKNLTYLKILEKNDIPYYFVFEKKYAEDSLIIKEELMLESYKGQYLWSDSLYRKYTGHKDSEIHLLSSCSNNKISMEINKFDVSMAELMVHKYKEVDTLRFDSDVLNAQISQIFSDNNKIYFKRQLRQDVITCMDIVNNKKRQYVLNDSIVKGNFLSYFGGLKEYETIHLINRPKKNIFHYFNVSNDTLYAVSSHLYIYKVEGDDTTPKNFYVLNKFHDGRFVQSYPLANMDLGNGYWSSTYLHYYNGEFFNFIMNFQDLPLQEYKIMAKLKVENDRLKFNEYTDFLLPEEYKHLKYNMCHPVFYKQYALIPFSRNLYNLKDESFRVLDIKENGIVPTSFDFNTVNQIIAPITVDENYVWFISNEQGVYNRTITKYDLTKDAIVVHKKIEEDYLFPFLDDFDKNYIYIPIDSKTLVHINIDKL